MRPAPAPRTGRARTATAVALVAVAATLAAMMSGCSTTAAVDVMPPVTAAPGCARLHDALPDEVDGRDRRGTTPTSRLTAAWGDPALVLRCGVARPGGLSPTSEVLVVDGVQWFLTELPRAYVFTTVGRRAYVELTVPVEVPREQATAPLVDLADPVEQTVRAR